MAPRPLSFKEIVGIIKAAASNGVSELRFGGLDITFRAMAPQQLSPPNTFDQYNEKITDPVTAISEPDEDVEEFKRSQDLINDPEAFETAMIEDAAKE